MVQFTAMDSFLETPRVDWLLFALIFLVVGFLIPASDFLRVSQYPSFL